MDAKGASPHLGHWPHCMRQHSQGAHLEETRTVSFDVDMNVSGPYDGFALSS